MAKNSKVADIFQLSNEADDAFSTEILAGDKEPSPTGAVPTREGGEKPTPPSNDQTTPRDTSETEQVDRTVNTGSEDLLSPEEARERIKSGQSVNMKNVDNSGQQKRTPTEARKVMRGDNPPESVNVETAGKGQDFDSQDDTNRTIQKGLQNGTLKRTESGKGKPREELTNSDVVVDLGDVAGGNQTNQTGGGQTEGGATGTGTSGSQTKTTGTQTETTNTTGEGAGAGAGAGSQETSLSAIFGTEEGEQGTGEKLAGLFDVDTPDTEQGEASQRKETAKERISDALDPSEEKERAEKFLDNRLTSIESRFERKREAAERKSNNQRKEQVSNLVSTGVVNPVSSGVASIGTASKQALDRRKDALGRAERAAKAKARAEALGLKTEAEEKALQAAQTELERINQQEQQRVENQQQKFENKISLVNSKLDAYQTGRELDQEEKDKARQGVLDLVENFGTEAFKGMDESSLEDLANSAGYNAEAFKTGVRNLKKEELQNEELNLREVGGSLYNIGRGEDGSVVANKIISDPDESASGAGGGGGTAGTGGTTSGTTSESEAEKTFDEWLQEQTEEDFTKMGFENQSPDPSDPQHAQILKDQYEEEQKISNLSRLSEDFFDRAKEIRSDLGDDDTTLRAARKTLRGEYPEASANAVKDILEQPEEEKEFKGDTFKSGGVTYDLGTQTGREKALNLGRGAIDEKIKQYNKGKATKQEVKAVIDKTVAKKGFPDRVESALESYLKTKADFGDNQG